MTKLCMYVVEISNELLFSLLISTHEILSMNDPTVLKFNYSFALTTTLIYKYRLQWVWAQCWYQTHNIWFIRLLIQIHKFRKIFISLINDSNHSSKFTVLVVLVAFTKKKKEKGKESKQSKHTTFYWVL